MAVFSNLHDLGQVFAKSIETRLDTPLPLGHVVAGPPLENPGSTTEQVRVTVLWLNEQPTHKNDGYHRRLDGTLAPPPLSLSAFALVTTYGSNATGEPAGAYQLLGNVLQVFHDAPTLELPLLALPGKGSGDLGVALVPLVPEAVEKLFNPFQMKHRPFALYELSPVQIRSKREEEPPAPVVLPGGPTLAGPSAMRRPDIERVAPDLQAPGGRVRVDGAWESPVTAVRIGNEVVNPPQVTEIAPGRALVVQVPALLPLGATAISVTTGTSSSEPSGIRLVASSEATLDALAVLTHSRAANLTLTGRGLAGATEVVAWPDKGATSPADFHKLPVAGGTAAQVTVAAAELAVLGDRVYRLAVHVAPSVYTSFVVLEMRP